MTAEYSTTFRYTKNFEEDLKNGSENNSNNNNHIQTQSISGWSVHNKFDLLGSSPMRSFDLASMHDTSNLDIDSMHVQHQNYLQPPLSPRLSSPLDGSKHINNDSAASRNNVDTDISPLKKLKKNNKKRRFSQSMENKTTETENNFNTVSNTASNNNTNSEEDEDPEYKNLRKDYGTLDDLLLEVQSTLPSDKPSGLYDESTKPPYSYAAMIALSIMESGQGRLTLSNIYTWISNHFPFYRLGDSGWQNSIRHNLSLNESFIKGGKCSDGKGHFWQIKPGQEYKVLRVQSKNGRNSNSANNSKSAPASFISTKEKEKVNSKNHSRETNVHLQGNNYVFKTGSVSDLNNKKPHSLDATPQTPKAKNSNNKGRWAWENGEDNFDSFDTPLILNNSATKNVNEAMHKRMDNGKEPSESNTNHLVAQTDNSINRAKLTRNNNNLSNNIYSHTVGTISEPIITHQKDTIQFFASSPIAGYTHTSNMHINPQGFSCSFNSSFESPSSKTLGLTSPTRNLNMEKGSNHKNTNTTMHFDLTQTPRKQLDYEFNPFSPDLKEVPDHLSVDKKHACQTKFIVKTPQRSLDSLISTPKITNMIGANKAKSQSFNDFGVFASNSTPKWKTPSTLDEFFTSPMILRSPKNMLMPSTAQLHNSLDDQVSSTPGLLFSPNKKKMLQINHNGNINSPRGEVLSKKPRIAANGGLYGVDVFSVLQRALASQKFDSKSKFNNSQQQKLLPHPTIEEKK